MKVSLFEISYKKKWTFSPFSNFVYIYLYNAKIINITLLFLPPFFEILKPIVVPFIHNHHLMLQHDNAWPNVARICTQFLKAENIPVLAWPAYSPNMSPIEHVWDALDRCIRQRVPVPANIQQLHTAIEEEWTNIPQATINNLINSIALCEANGYPIMKRPCVNTLWKAFETDINPIAQTTSGGGKCIWLLKSHMLILLLPKY